MNPNNKEQSDLLLPQATLGEQALPDWHEKLPPVASPEAAGARQPQSYTPTIPLGSMPLSDDQPSNSKQSQGYTALVATPVTADDSDLIEKEWVDKAKAIVAGTSDDPYVQSKEVSRFKAEYIKKRYNKDIKLPES